MSTKATADIYGANTEVRTYTINANGQVHGAAQNWIKSIGGLAPPCVVPTGKKVHIFHAPKSSNN